MPKLILLFCYLAASNQNINHNNMYENDANDNNTIQGVSLLSNGNVSDLAIAW